MSLSATCSVPRLGVSKSSDRCTVRTRKHSVERSVKHSERLHTCSITWTTSPLCTDWHACARAHSSAGSFLWRLRNASSVLLKRAFPVAFCFCAGAAVLTCSAGALLRSLSICSALFCCVMATLWRAYLTECICFWQHQRCWNQDLPERSLRGSYDGCERTLGSYSSQRRFLLRVLSVSCLCTEEEFCSGGSRLRLRPR